MRKVDLFGKMTDGTDVLGLVLVWFLDFCKWENVKSEGTQN